jgi:hypothetical protein
MMFPFFKVTRGPDWIYQPGEDLDAPYGRITAINTKKKTCTVKWTSVGWFSTEMKEEKYYRIGLDGKFDLCIYFDKEHTEGK